jgi:1-acyl-sn-glycerol-3-phosphate acyltransferase
MDICTLIIFFFPSFVSKSDVKSFPGVGSVAKAIDCVFVDRAGSKEEKILIGQQIE